MHYSRALMLLYHTVQWLVMIDRFCFRLSQITSGSGSSQFEHPLAGTRKDLLDDLVLCCRSKRGSAATSRPALQHNCDGRKQRSEKRRLTITIRYKASYDMM